VEATTASVARATERNERNAASLKPFFASSTLPRASTNTNTDSKEQGDTMSTRPKHDAASIATDAKRIAAVAREDLADKNFAKRVSKGELDGFDANIGSLESGEAARTTTLHAKVAAGTHVATARSALFHVIENVRDDVKLEFPTDTAMQHTFGVGAIVHAGTTSSVLHVAHELLAAAAAHAKEAAKVGLDAKGVHHLEDLVHAIEGTELAHVHAATARHDNAMATDSLAHLVAAEAAHLRLVARRVFRGDEAKLHRYATTLPRHEVVPRKKAAAAPSTPAT
jgi:hypothetical protein